MASAYPQGLNMRQVTAEIAWRIGLNNHNYQEHDDGFLYTDVGEPLWYETLEHMHTRETAVREDRERNKGRSPYIQEAQQREDLLRRIPNAEVKTEIKQIP
jgi:hypothetical protein